MSWSHLTEVYNKCNLIPICDECGLECNDSYMVKDRVWIKEAKMKPNQHLHLKCLIKRLGRKLTVKDITDAPINNERDAVEMMKKFGVIGVK